MNEIELKRKRIETGVKVAAALVVSFLVAPFIFIAIKGLIGLIIAATVAVVAIQFAPYFAALVGNWRLKAIKAEAAKNPVETLQRDYENRQNLLNNFMESIRNFAAEVANFESKLETFAKNYPNEVPKFNEQLSKMKELLTLRKAKYKEAQKGLASYALEIQKANALWDMSQAAAQMTAAAGVDNEEFLAKIQRETALDSVQKSLNLAFSDLELALEDEKGKTQVIEIQATKVS